MRYWLLKSEPDAFGIDDLARARRQTAAWDGVRNYQARNMLRDEFKVGDRAFFHHSSCAVPGIYGTVEVVRAGHPDPTAFDRSHPHFDVGSDPKNPRWYQVKVRLLRKFVHPVTLASMREHVSGPLRDFILLRRGTRLSVMPVTAEEWKFIHHLARVATT